jgi:hypothetical protein
MQRLGSLIYITLSNGVFYFLNFIISSFSEYQVILILEVCQSEATKNSN